jgi:metallophosphoesterase (TIGR03767 family)
VSGEPPLTTDRRLGPGAVLRTGGVSQYRAVQALDGEAHLIRTELHPGGGPDEPGRPLLCLAHITDLQLADVQSPTRFEFLNGRWDDPRYTGLWPCQRPQEVLTAHAVDALISTLRNARGPATGLSPSLAVTTGDAIDNAQWNELQMFLALFDGGLVAPDSGGPAYEGVQSPDWPDDIFWVPDHGKDLFRREFGFPHHPGLLERALRSFFSDGLGVPWLACFGNHEGLNQGVGAVTPSLAAALTADRKPTGLPAGFPHEQAIELFTRQPEAFLAGPYRQVTADPGRRPVTRRDFVRAHLTPGSSPHGHGFTEQNLTDGTTYYTWDTPAVRFIALDTNGTGGANGCLDRQQASWLEERLAETGDRLVIVFSHHGSDTLDNTHQPGADGDPSLGAAELIAILRRHPQVVLWLNGHTHTNAVRPHGGFWEVTTCAVADWPCQARLVELTDHGGYLSIVATMVDHDTPLAPISLDTALYTGAELASLHRELAMNVPLGVLALAGQAADRNVRLRLPVPFPLGQLEAPLLL